jgi:hypothetical protein
MKLAIVVLQGLKVLALFAGGLYLLGFGLFHGSNAKGLIDALLPYEWVGCTILGASFLAWSAKSYVGLWRLLK